MHAGGDARPAVRAHHAAARAPRNGNKRAAATFLHKVTSHAIEEDTAKAITEQDFVPNLSPMNLTAFGIEKQFMLSHGYIEHDFKVSDWNAPEYAEEAFKSL
jgi:hypothetical protein